jgi:hypothetical protein
MFPKYNISNATTNIEIEVKMGTVGIAFSGIYLSPPGQQWQAMPDTDSHNGNINRYNLGQPQHLQGKYLLIQSQVDFSIIDESLWKNQQENLILRYNLYGGDPNPMPLSYTNDELISSKKGKLIVINKIILLS